MTTLQTELPPLSASDQQALATLGNWVDERVLATDEFAASGKGGDQEPCVAPRELISQAGNLGLLDLDSRPESAGISHSVQLLQDLAGRCVTSTFSLWAHRMVLEYLSHAPADAAALQRLRQDMIRGEQVGVTAFAAALQASAGVGSLTVQARRVAGGLVLDGKVMWASNLVPDAKICVPVRVVDADGQDAGQSVVVVPADAAGLTTRFMPDLMAMSNTASGMLQFSGVEVAAEWIVSTDLAGFLPRTRPVLLLLQSALALGLARRCLEEAEALLPQRGNITAPQVTKLRADAEALARAVHAASKDPWQVPYRELVEIRLGVVHLAVGAAQAEHVLRGGAGYVRASGTNRRLRESLFLPVQSPSEVQLRQELQRLEQN